MSLLVSADALRQRRDFAAGPLAPLAMSLARDLEPLLRAPLFIPEEKAQLSRAGGRCERDGSLLEFDPFAPRHHRCPLCGTVYIGESHYRFWIYWYQLWLAERAVHAALLSALGAGPSLASLARRILLRYAELYPRYPNVDNVLGPTRLFFSTYLESIWLLQICVALDFLELSGDAEIGSKVRERLIEPSSAIIAEYDEGASNRQVWNVAALLAAYRSLGRDDAARRIVSSPSGLRFHLGHGLLEDGTWYEGENYHQFAHRGLWYGVTMAERAGFELPSSLVRRFEEGFATPLLTALPDFTLPARRDSQYRISLRQWRYAEMFELGLARRDDRRLVGALARLYTDDVPRRPTGRDRSSAEAERNVPASALAREDLGWRSLLFARSVLPPLESVAPESCLLPEQGLAVIRREQGSVYVALDYGHSGGGHGHPDRLNLLLADGDARWLDDMGTGSYVDPSLHWYRSTLAHNAPLVGGRSQERVHGELVAFEEQGTAGWCSARADGISPGVVVTRTIVAMSEYLLDVVEWEAEQDITLDLPIHLDARIVTLDGFPLGEFADLASASLEGSTELEDGFRFVSDSARAALRSEVSLQARSSTRMLRAWCGGWGTFELWRAAAPGPPPPASPRQDHPFWLVRAAGREGEVHCVYAWSDAVQGVEMTGSSTTTVNLGDGITHVHAPGDDGWRIEMFTNGARTGIDLGGLVPQRASRKGPPRSAETGGREPATEIVLLEGEPRRFELGEPHYRRSEEAWRDAGSPTADVALTWSGAELRVEIVVPRSDLTFVAADAENRWDNENADVNGDGVQLYVETSHGRSAWMLVPDEDGVRTRAIDGWTHARAVRATWHREAHGYVLVADVSLVDLELEDPHVAIDVVVNEKPAGRDRRRGQLVLSGAYGEFVYLRGDRHDAHRLLHLELMHG